MYGGVRGRRRKPPPTRSVIHIPVSETEIEEYYDQGLDDNTIRKILLERVKLLENEIVLMESLKSAANVVSIEDY